MPPLHAYFAIAFWLLFAGTAVGEPVFAPGSRLGLEPPPGFVPSNSFKGFVHRESGGSIMISEFPVAAFQDMISTTDDKFATRGIFVESRRELSLAPGPALLVMGRQKASGKTYVKWMLIVGARAFTGVISAQVPLERSKGIAAQISESLQTVIARASLSLDSQLAALPFDVGVIAPMRIVRLLGGNTVLLTRGPNDMLLGAEQPILMISRSKRPAPAGVSLETVARQAFARLKAISNPKIEMVDQVTFAGGEGVEIVASAVTPETGEPVGVVQWLRYVGDGYLMVLGVANAASRAADLTMFRKILNGIKPK